MLTEGEIDAMRECSADALPATCTVTRDAGAGAFNATTGRHSDPTPIAVWSGACCIRSSSAAADAEVGDLHEAIGKYVATLPHDAADVEVNDFLTVATGTDPLLVGRRLRIIDVRWSEWMIDRRLVLEDLLVHPEVA